MPGLYFLVDLLISFAPLSTCSVVSAHFFTPTTTTVGILWDLPPCSTWLEYYLPFSIALPTCRFVPTTVFHHGFTLSVL